MDLVCWDMSILDEVGSGRERCDTTTYKVDICFFGLPFRFFMVAINAVMMRMRCIRVRGRPVVEVLF